MCFLPVLQSGPQGPVLDELVAPSRPCSKPHTEAGPAARDGRTLGPGHPPAQLPSVRSLLPLQGTLSAHTSPPCHPFTPPTALTDSCLTSALRSDRVAADQASPVRLLQPGPPLLGPRL